MVTGGWFQILAFLLRACLSANPTPVNRKPIPSLGDRLQFRLFVAEEEFVVFALLQGHFKEMCCCRCCGSVRTLFVWLFPNDGRKEGRNGWAGDGRIGVEDIPRLFVECHVNGEESTGPLSELESLGIVSTGAPGASRSMQSAL